MGFCTSKVAARGKGIFKPRDNKRTTRLSNGSCLYDPSPITKVGASAPEVR
jgi:hypothetical protein